MNFQKITGEGEEKPISLRSVSKDLSKILRHQALKLGLQMNDEGYVKVDDILALKRFANVNFDIIKEVVDTNDKKRFTMKEMDGVWFVKANQGHSIKLKNPNLRKVLSPSEIPVVVHGTFFEHLDSILENGLLCKGRTHIHFAKGLIGEKGVISGMRHNYQVAIFVDSEKAMQDGIEFFISENEVILSTGIDGKIEKKYFKKIINRSGEEIKF